MLLDKVPLKKKKIAPPGTIRIYSEHSWRTLKKIIRLEVRIVRVHGTKCWPPVNSFYKYYSELSVVHGARHIKWTGSCWTFKRILLDSSPNRLKYLYSSREWKKTWYWDKTYSSFRVIIHFSVQSTINRNVVSWTYTQRDLVCILVQKFPTLIRAGKEVTAKYKSLFHPQDSEETKALASPLSKSKISVFMCLVFALSPWKRQHR